MANKHPMPLDVGRFLNDTQQLDGDERGAYVLLLMQAWLRRDCKLPDDDERLARLCGQTLRRWRKKFRPALEPYFDVKNGVWQNSAQLGVLAEHQKVVAQKRLAGNKSARIRASKTAETSQCDSTAVAEPLERDQIAYIDNNIDSIGARARPVPIPTDFKPNGTFEQTAALKGWTQDQIDSALTDFILHHRAQGTRLADWSAKFTQWMHRQPRFEQQAQGTRERNGTESAADYVKRVKRRNPQLWEH